MNLNNIFPSYVAHEKLDLDLEELTAYCYEKQAADPAGIIKSNNGGWHSNDLDASSDKIRPLLNSIIRVSTDLIGHYELDDIFVLQKFWININKKCDYNVLHVHPNSVISGCFYVKVPENSGNIVFQNPNPRVVFFENLFKKNNHLTCSRHSYVPKENMIYMFPSWLEHYVEPNRSDRDRISISFNIGTQND